jgi:hypothetical protein
LMSGALNALPPCPASCGRRMPSLRQAARRPHRQLLLPGRRTRKLPWSYWPGRKALEYYRYSSGPAVPEEQSLSNKTRRQTRRHVSRRVRCSVPFAGRIPMRQARVNAPQALLRAAFQRAGGRPALPRVRESIVKQRHCASSAVELRSADTDWVGVLRS